MIGLASAVARQRGGARKSSPPRCAMAAERRPARAGRGGGITRDKLLESARAVFVEAGVAGAGLEQIARHAGVTRAAVYWHFSDKTDLLRTIVDDLGRRLYEVQTQVAIAVGVADPLTRLEEELRGVLAAVHDEPALGESLKIVYARCVFVGELAALGAVVARGEALLRARIAAAYRAAGEAGLLRDGVDQEQAAAETGCFLFGLLRAWASGNPATDAAGSPERLIGAHFALRR